MTSTVDTAAAQIVELDERESNGIRVTLVYDRVTLTPSVLVWDQQAQRSFVLEVLERESPWDVFHHPFAYAAFRGLKEPTPEQPEALAYT